MYQPTRTKKSLSESNSKGVSRWRRGLLIGALALICFALSPIAQAVTPAPDGGYPNETTAEGTDALFSLTTGFGNTATGFDALYNTTSGNYNTATGDDALLSNSAGSRNTANGGSALFSNTTGNDNTATGDDVLFYNTTGNFNTGIGAFALLNNTTGSYNTATGVDALYYNTTGGRNTANGFNALFLNRTGHSNTATGYYALPRNTTGNFNTAIGDDALSSNTNGTNNIALGSGAGGNLTTGDNNIEIGNVGVHAESDTIRIGTGQANTYIAGISGATVPGGIGVIIDTTGHLGTSASSARYKENIQPIDKASEAILALQPVTFRYKKDLDPAGIPQFGLVAEQVEKVNPNLVARDEKGRPYSVRYEAVNAMLLNEFLKEHRKVESLQAAQAEERRSFESALAQQQKQIQAVMTTVKEQAAQLQKVSNQLEPTKPAPRVVANDQ